MIEYRMPHVNEINRELFRHFKRHQAVTKCWRKISGVWCIKDIAFTDEWTERDYAFLVSCLKNTVQTGGMVSGAFFLEQLKGFASVESALFGRNKEYLDLSSMYRKICEAEESAGSYSALRKTGQSSMVRRNCIFPRTPQWKARHSTVRWVVWKHRNTTRSMWQKSLATANWNVLSETAISN